MHVVSIDKDGKRMKKSSRRNNNKLKRQDETVDHPIEINL